MAAKHRSRQARAQERKIMELHRKNPYSKMKRSPENKHKSKVKSTKSRSPKKRREEEQVEELSKWENKYVSSSSSSNKQRPDRPIVKNLVLIPDKEPTYHNKAALPAKSPLSLLNQKMKYQKEYDALEGLKKRRELIQKRLNEISERHRQRQIKKQHRYKNHSNINASYNQQRQSERDSKSEQPFVLNPIQSSNKNRNLKSSKSQQGSPYKPDTQLRGNQIQVSIQYSSPNKSNISNNNTNTNSTKSISQSPLKYAGANAIGISGNSSSASSMSVSPESEPKMSSNMTARERMQARKRAKADARARQLKEASKLEFHQNKLQAAQNKYQVSGRIVGNANNSNADNTMSRAASMGIFEDVSMQDRDIISDISSGGAMSEPPYLISTMNEYSRDIMTIKEAENESVNIEEEEEEEEEEQEEDEIAEEIDELKQTLVEHINQIEEIKKTILLKKKEQLSDSDNDGVDDVETLLNEQEQTMKTMRFQNNMDQDEDEDEEENEDGAKDEYKVEDEESESSSSEEMPIGRIVDRIEFIKRKCISGMGLQGFKIGYNLMKQLQYEDKDELVSAIDNKIRQLCNKPNISKSRVEKYRGLIDQLLFIEANCS